MISPRHEYTFLFCKEDDGSDSIYIGEAENVKERLV
jgi:peptide-methionine (S)-S-oxide reductase